MLLIDGKGLIAVIFEFLLCVNNAISLKLVKFAEFPKPSNQDILKSLKQFLVLIARSEASHTLHQRGKFSREDIHSLCEVLAAFGTAFLLYVVIEIQNVFYGFDECHWLIADSELVLNRLL